jgi:hypothetical protein
MPSYLDEMFDAQIVAREGIVRRDKFNIDRYGLFEKLLRRCRRENHHLIETGSQYVVLCNPGV